MANKVEVNLFTSILKFLCQQQFGGQGEGHHEHGHVGRTQALLGQQHQAAAPQQQAHVEIQIAELHQPDALRGKHSGSAHKEHA